jgi:type IV fimbrial biogenesis protein FimU
MKKIQSGFTLVELMVTITVAAILLAIGVPSLTSLYESVRAQRNIEEIHNIFGFARNQAISYGTSVSVDKLKSPDWEGGVKVTLVDADGNTQQLKVINAFNSQDKISGPSQITFTPDGLSSGGNLIYCPNGEAIASKSVIVSESGLVSFGADGKSCKSL